MNDRVVENDSSEVPSIPEILEKVMLFTLDEAKEKLSQSGEVVPFTALVVKDNLFLESHPGETADACFAAAKHTVEGARGADAYAFCYDGYIDTDAGEKDCLISEGGIPGEPEGMAIGFLYTESGENIIFEDEPAYIGEAPNFMEGLKESSYYEEDEINERYLEEDEVEEDHLNKN